MFLGLLGFSRLFFSGFLDARMSSARSACSRSAAFLAPSLCAAILPPST